jgi:hypothetical protein
MHVEKATIPEKLGGTYLGPVFPETPKFKNPEDDLRDVGITTVKRPEFPR